IEKLIPKKTHNHDIAINNQQDLITTLSRHCALKIDFGCAKSRMGDLFVSGLGRLTDVELRNKR
ncbi:MAG: hypothetical protein ACXW0Q_15925, partial [Methylovulum sp.]